MPAQVAEASSSGEVGNAVVVTQKKSKTSSTFHFTAGLATGMLSALLLQPVDLLKTRVQQSHTSDLRSALRAILSPSSPSSIPSSTGAAAAAAAAAVQPKRNAWTTIRQLWKGTLPSVLRTGFGSALYFTTLSRLRSSSLFLPSASPTSSRSSASSSSPANPTSQTTSALPRLTPTANLASGALARVLAGTVLMPVTVLKVRLESSLPGASYPTLRAAAADVLRREGARGFWAGFGATALRDAPYAGLYVAFYEAGKVWLGRVVGGGGGGGVGGAGAGAGGDGGVVVLSGGKAATVNFAAGAAAAGFATAVTNPFDAVKTRLQLRPEEYQNSVKAAVRMVREEGWRSLMDGLGLRVGRKALSSALAWTLYEEIIKGGEKRKDRD